MKRDSANRRAGRKNKSPETRTALPGARREIPLCLGRDELPGLMQGSLEALAVERGLLYLGIANGRTTTAVGFRRFRRVPRIVRLQSRKANPEISPSVGMQPPRGFPRSKDGRCPRLSPLTNVIDWTSRSGYDGLKVRLRILLRLETPRSCRPHPKVLWR